MVDFSLMRGEDWVRCCICGALHVDPYPDLHRDTDGELMDICVGECAAQAGVR